EEMSVLNAIPTAEGAIQLALEEMPITLHDSKALVLGYGRIGKVLSKMLHGIGAKVYVAARKYSDLAWIEANGYTPIRMSDFSVWLNEFDVIFNTVPHVILDAKELQNIKMNALIVDLASKPGGINFEKAKEIGLKAIWALSLPGKVAPVTAAKYIKDTIYNIISEG
ncbi:MAG: NAD(P)-dependent oxidoreductase, partial [Deltaproteobacteria bacterium]